MYMKTDKSKSSRVKNLVCGSVLLALGLSANSAMAEGAMYGSDMAHGYAQRSHGFKPITPFSRIAKLPAVRNSDGSVNYEATYAKARAASVAIAAYVARMRESDMLGLDVIQGIDWKLGGTTSNCLSTRTCTDTEIDKAVLAIPSSDLINPTLPASAANTKKANVMDFCNEKYAKMALGVDPIIDNKKIVNGYSHAPALPCALSVWNDDKHVYVDMLDPSAIFTLFFTDVLFSADMQDAAFADALNAMPPQVKSEITAIVHAALSAYDANMEIMDKKIGPVFRSMEQIVDTVAASPYQSPYLHMAYTKQDGGVFTEVESKAVAQAIINTLSTDANKPGVHPTVIDANGSTLDSILSANSSWRSGRLEPITIPGNNHIIEACSPYFAKMALGTGLHHANALPCEITVKIIDGGSKLVVSYLDPAFMLNALFADITDEEKAAFADIPGKIMNDLQAVVWAALRFNSGIVMNEPSRIAYDMLP